MCIVNGRLKQEMSVYTHGCTVDRKPFYVVVKGRGNRGNHGSRCAVELTHGRIEILLTVFLT